jgi:hypothetical protein
VLIQLDQTMSVSLHKADGQLSGEQLGENNFSKQYIETNIVTSKARLMQSHSPAACAAVSGRAAVAWQGAKHVRGRERPSIRQQ